MIRFDEALLLSFQQRKLYWQNKIQ